MTTYVDTSALLKLVFREAETPAVQAWIAGTTDTLVSSRLIHPEAHCAARRRDGAVGHRAVDAVLALLTAVDLVRVDLDDAAAGGLGLRAAEAIHLATARRLGADAMLVYDAELAEAAAASGLRVIAPR